MKSVILKVDIPINMKIETSEYSFKIYIYIKIEDI